MARYDLAFFLCCCKSFLGNDPDGQESFYELLGVDRDATAEEIKQAYRKQSLQMHPDKLAQRGQTVTGDSQAKFTRMKEAYEILSDPHKRDTYNAIGERGLKWLEEPFSVDPQELAHNFATSSVLDRSKIFAIFVAAAIAVLIQPVLICLHVDGAFGENASWFATLTPLWLWNAFFTFYHARVIMMGPIQRPESIPEAEWVDPLPMKKRVYTMVKFLLLFLFQLLVAFRVDALIKWPWFVVFFPLYLFEGSIMWKKFPISRMRIVTVEDLEAALGKSFSQFTPAEKELIGSRYSVVSSTTSPDFAVAQKLKSRARHDVVKSVFRIIFVVLLLVQLDGNLGWNWWAIFLPIWLVTVLMCYSNWQSYSDVQQMAAEKDPHLFGENKQPQQTEGLYGAVDANGNPATEPAKTSNLTEEQREELRAQVVASSGKLCTKCCSQGFFLCVAFLFVGKIQGAGYSAFLVISPFLVIAALFLGCMGLAIFGITEVPTDGVDFEDENCYSAAEEGMASPGVATPAQASAAPIVPPYIPPPQPSTTPFVCPPTSPPVSRAIPAPAPVVEPKEENTATPVDLLDSDDPPDQPPRIHQVASAEQHLNDLD